MFRDLQAAVCCTFTVYHCSTSCLLIALADSFQVQLAFKMADDLRSRLEKNLNIIVVGD